MADAHEPPRPVTSDDDDERGDDGDERPAPDGINDAERRYGESESPA